ncbi:MAG TPA: hypothetical protein VKS78_00845 [Roseiarcus sp.]|nr:hypothetical protein [Roseiarcus sp.]
MANIQTSGPQDAAADAARLLQRLGFAVLAIGGPCAELLSSRAIFVFFPIGVALLLVSATLHPVRGATRRMGDALGSPLLWCGLALLGWAALSLLWTPFPTSAVTQLGKVAGTAFLAFLAVGCMRDHMRAGDLYLFPVGVLLSMCGILGAALAVHAGAMPNDGRIGRAGVTLVMLLWPAMAGLAARGRNGYARLLLILAAVFVFATGAPVTAAALLVGVLALSFAISDIKRTIFDFGVIAAAIVLLSPLAPALAPTAARWFYSAKLAALDEPFPPLAAAAEILLHDPFRLFTGHGFYAAVRGIENGLLPPRTPRVALFEVWYELGIIGAALSAAIVWQAFRSVGGFGVRIAPYIVAALASTLTLAFLGEDVSQMWWVTVMAISAISTAAAFHSQYRTKRPLAAVSHPTL